MSNVIRSNQVLIQNPVETNYKVILEKLIKAKAEIEHYEQKIKGTARGIQTAARAE